MLICDAKNVSTWLWDFFWSLLKVSKKNLCKSVDAMTVAQQLKQSSQVVLHVSEEDVRFAAFYSMETAFNHPEGLSFSGGRGKTRMPWKPLCFTEELQ